MGSRTIESGKDIYEAGKDPVQSLDIIIKGSVRASNDYCAVDLPAGSIIGIGETTGTPYVFTYEAAEELTIYSYPYESEASLVALFKSNPKLLGTLVAGSVRFAQRLQTAVLDAMELARGEYASFQRSFEEYPSLAISVGEQVRDFDSVKDLKAPEMLDKARGWHRDFVEDLNANEATFKKAVYPIPSIGLGFGLTINSYALESMDFMREVIKYLDEFTAGSRDFLNHYQLLKERSSAKSAVQETPSADSGDASVMDFRGALKSFTEINPELYDHFFLKVSEFIKNPNRYGNDDVARTLRRDIATDFYEVYQAVMLQATVTDWEEIPMGIRMFLLFGYVDANLAGADNVSKMCAIAKTLKPGAGGRIMTMYEWLLLIYQGKVMPSKNEFDLDYPNYLKELKRGGSISEKDEKRLLDSMKDRLRFEIKNLFTSGNRVTFGRITTFVPIFDKENVVRALEQSYVNAPKINEQIDAIRKIDYGAFCRQGVFSMPEAGVNAYYTTDEILPFVILMPNSGSRATLWQEIDSKKRNTPARMIISIFHTENLADTMMHLVAEFRWDMCRTEQGVHWNDVSDPSLTSLYFDYLQFYRKNSALSQDAKDKLSMALKSNANNFKKVFVADYCTYIKYESQGALRMNKVARGILFAFCPFSHEALKAVADNPQYAPLITKHEAELVQKKKTIRNLMIKIEKAGQTVPKRIQDQADFYEKV